MGPSILAIAVAWGLAVRVLRGPAVVGGRLVFQALAVSDVNTIICGSWSMSMTMRNAAISGVLAVFVGICFGEVVSWAGGLDVLPLLGIAV